MLTAGAFPNTGSAWPAHHDDYSPATNCCKSPETHIDDEHDAESVPFAATSRERVKHREDTCSRSGQAEVSGVNMLTPATDCCKAPEADIDDEHTAAGDALTATA